MLRIAIYGSECTGKTTLARYLADYYGTVWVPEYSREYAERKPDLGISDVIPIMQGQIAHECAASKIAKEKGYRFIICDTIPLSSIVYSQYYNGDIPEGVEAFVGERYDLYLLTDIDIPWQDDDIRGHNIDRSAMHALFRCSLVARNLPFKLLSGSFDARVVKAKQFIDAIINKGKKVQ